MVEEKGFQLSRTSKMPGFSFSVPNLTCKTGSKLKKIPGSVCAKCYAGRGNYLWPNSKNLMGLRYAALRSKDWVPRMAAMIRAHESSGYFRWHDSGDLQGIWHLENICAVARLLPEIRFWLPTKEGKLVDRFRATHGPEPGNLTIRVSAHMVGEVDTTRPVTSMVVGKHQTVVPANLFHCKAPTQGNQCLLCRACWDRNVELVGYKEK